MKCMIHILKALDMYKLLNIRKKLKHVQILHILQFWTRILKRKKLFCDHLHIFWQRNTMLDKVKLLTVRNQAVTKCLESFHKHSWFLLTTTRDLISRQNHVEIPFCPFWLPQLLLPIPPVTRPISKFFVTREANFETVFELDISGHFLVNLILVAAWGLFSDGRAGTASADTVFWQPGILQCYKD